MSVHRLVGRKEEEEEEKEKKILILCSFLANLNSHKIGTNSNFASHNIIDINS